MKIRTFIVASLVAMLAAGAASMAAPPDDAKGKGKIEGQVVAVRQSTQTHTGNEGEFTEIRVRTRTQQEMWLRLGEASEMGERFQVGTRVRARWMRGAGDDDVVLATRIADLDTGKTVSLRDGNGDLLRTQDRDHLRDGTGDGVPDRDRIQDRKGGHGGGGRHGGRS